MVIRLEKEKVRLDEILKFLFSTSNKVLVKLLNGIFDENFDVDEVELAVSNNEFVEDDLGILRGDIFFDLINRNQNKVSYHIEFQTKNDSTMIIRLFEYGFKKGKEQSRLEKDSLSDIRTIYFPKQKVIFFEENKSIEDTLKLRIVFPHNQEVVYAVEVMKYWEYTDEELKEKQMYPLLPLQLFSLRKEIEKVHQKQDIFKLKQLSAQAKELAVKLAYESKTLFENDEILGEDFHKMLLAIQNLIEYLSRNYFNDEILEKEVNTMTKTLYDPEVERRGIQRGIEQGIEQGERIKALEIAKNLLELGMNVEQIVHVTKLCKEEILTLTKEK